MANYSRVALVTGAGSGIGQESAKQLAADGFTVALLGRTLDKLEETKRQILDAGGKAQSFACEISDAQSLIDAVTRAQKALGTISVIVSNAGTGIPPATVDQQTLETWEYTFNVNSRAPFLLARQLFPAMKEQGWGRMINIGSILGLTAADINTIYVASKHASVGLTKALAVEWGRHGITSNAICPGYTNTPILQGYAFANLHERLPTPGGKMGEPTQHAQIVSFLAQENSHYLNGAIIVADGGLMWDMAIQ